MREVAELFQNLVEFLADVVESLCGLWIRELAGQADSDAECGQVLLRPVMEVALDPSALSVARGNDAFTCCAKLRVHRPDLGRQATVLEGQQQRLTCGSDELRVCIQSPVVHDHGHCLAVLHDRSRRLARRRRGRKRLAARVDKAAGLLESEPDLERWIIECSGQRRAKLTGARVLYHAGDDLLQHCRSEERAHHDRKQKSVWRCADTDGGQPGQLRERVRIQVHELDTGCVEDQEQSDGRQNRGVDRQECPPSRPRRRRQPEDQVDEDCGADREQVVVRDVAAEKTVGDRRPIGDHEAVRGTRSVAAGLRKIAIDDRREKERGNVRLQSFERDRAKQRPSDAIPDTTLRECEDDTKPEKNKQPIGQHTGAAEKWLSRSLKRHHGRADRDREKEETESIARASNQPVERRAEPSHDHHGDHQAECDRVDEMVARREEEARSDRDEEPSDRSGDQDAAASEDRRDGRRGSGDGGR